MTNKELIDKIFKSKFPYFEVKYRDNLCTKGNVICTMSDSNFGSFNAYGNVSRFYIGSDTFRTINFGDGYQIITESIDTTLSETETPVYREVKYRDGAYSISISETKPSVDSSLIEGNIVSYDGKKKIVRTIELASALNFSILDYSVVEHIEVERNKNSTGLTQCCNIDSTTGIKTTGNEFFPEKEQLQGSLSDIRMLMVKELEINGTLDILSSIESFKRSPLFHEMLEKMKFAGKQY